MKKTLIGKIVSDKMQNTVVVAVEVPKRHRFYGKMIKNTRRFKARNLANAQLNDMVVITESRPYAKTVTWEVTEVLN